VQGSESREVAFKSRAPARCVSPNYFPRRRGFGAFGASSRTAPLRRRRVASHDVYRSEVARAVVARGRATGCEAPRSISEDLVMRLRPGLVAVALLVALPHRPSYAQARISSADSAIIARELAAWDALQKDDSGAAFQRVVGNSPTWVIVGPGGITRSSAAEMGRQITVNCDRGSNPIDSASVDHISNDVVILTYNVTVEGRCGSETAWTTTPMYSLTVWARKEGRWQLVAQGIAPRPGR